jgi:hypothetical protein
MGFPVTCPRCRKPGTLTLKRVKSIHYGFVTIVHGPEVVSILDPNDRARAEQLGLVVERKVYNPRFGKEQENMIIEKRLKQTYGPWTHPYVRHYDPEKYRQSMEKYKNGELKARPNGVRWCHIRTIPKEGEIISEYDSLLRKYDIRKYDIAIQDMHRDIKFNKFHIALSRRVKHEKQSRGIHPLFRIIESFEQKKRRKK